MHVEDRQTIVRQVDQFPGHQAPCEAPVDSSAGEPGNRNVSYL